MSVVLLAIGAVLAFALETSVQGTNMDAIGFILMAAGTIGLLVSLAFAATRRRDVDETTYVEGHTHSHPT